MTFKKYLDKLNQIAKDNPKTLGYTVVYGIDAEGNEFKTVEFFPSYGVFKSGIDYIDVKSMETLGIKEKCNAVCLN